MSIEAGKGAAMAGPTTGTAFGTKTIRDGVVEMIVRHVEQR